MKYERTDMHVKLGGRDMRLSLKVARLVNLVLAVMLTGHEFSGFLAIYPTLGRISPLARLEAEQGIYRRLGGIMPYYMGSTISSFLPALALGRGSSAFRFTLAGLACFVAMGAITRTGNLPINARIEELLAEEASFEEFRELRERWDRLHAVRNVLNVAGLVFAGLGALSEPRATETL